MKKKTTKGIERGSHEKKIIDKTQKQKANKQQIIKIKIKKNQKKEEKADKGQKKEHQPSQNKTNTKKDLRVTKPKKTNQKNPFFAYLSIYIKIVYFQ